MTQSTHPLSHEVPGTFNRILEEEHQQLCGITGARVRAVLEATTRTTVVAGY